MAKEKEAEKKEEELKRFYEPECPSTKPVYEWQVDDDGHHLYVQTGEKNFDDEIQLYKDTCDIKILVDSIVNGINRGDPEIIAKVGQGVYGDVNDYPEEYHVAAGSQALHQLYENQSDAVKAQFPTFELFQQYFTNLTAQMVENMFAPKEKEKQQTEVQDPKKVEVATNE